MKKKVEVRDIEERYEKESEIEKQVDHAESLCLDIMLCENTG